MRILFDDKFRWLKFGGALAVALVMAAYCRHEGAKRPIPGSVEYVNAFGGAIGPFPFQTVTGLADGIIFVKGDSGVAFKVEWPDTPPVIGDYVTFEGRLDGSVVRDVRHIIRHDNFNLKMYVSIIALMVVAYHLSSRIALRPGGLVLKNERPPEDA